MKAIIEIPYLSKYKYEFKSGTLKLDRVINYFYPSNYGFIPETLWHDKDPLDVFVISSEPIHPLSEVELEVLGVLKVVDNGEKDDKIIATLKGEDNVNINIQDIITFLRQYKKGVKVTKFLDKKSALEYIKQAQKMYRNTL